ncbi:acyl-CoA dehydrogenase [Acetobacter tropicalis]|uniref:3-sulfinopropanoyl-CoA desulfinase n=1 Tax=Acetobacter tropicalis TaxID=104102 RepID=A0A094ZEH0_9PROT|nr:acyl-CoA dehydrogenase family protein [Acetobacter tropicalis]KAA8383557.1 acyl-CoA dehydrogenase [Acetobacter tropicalis]KAA8389340.1 acyl-CoA dehydrogenase [Acetobacter tropicalis]KGB21031.1 Butyryl-CoA dehydrogenase [Acetobacter tropicalis]KXV47351.1 acyl-CoA dehydrogenase [Acetobacter tropicalis]MBC9008676.1 acyl-CoA dehydrogenase family protein [Acetobacter tropicalis]
MFLNEVQEQVLETTRSFVDAVIRPAAEALDREERFPSEIYDQMAELGLFGIGVPEELGGPGFDTLTYAVVMEELSRGYASIADQCGLVELISTLLVRHGTESQRKILPEILSMRRKVAYCITEPEAGTDVSGIRTTAERDGNGWVLNGGKIWIHNAPVADTGFVLARTNKDAGNRGMSIFIVDLHAQGVDRGPKEHKMGQRASQVGGLDFQDVRLGPDALLGEEGRGFHMMMSVLDKGRVGIASLAVGIAQAGLEAAVDYAGTRKQFGKHISEFQGVQWLLADMAKDIEAARLLVYSAASKIDRGLDATRSCSMAKCFAGDMAVARTADAVQVFGGSGYIRGFEVERLYRDAKITQIYEGTNQIQRMIIARELLRKGARS